MAAIKHPALQRSGKKSKIRPEVANSTRDEGRDFVLVSFRHYLKGKCEINRLTEKEARKALDILKLIGGGPAHQIGARGVSGATVGKTGSYVPLFAALDDGVDLLFHPYLSGTGRLFYFMDSHYCHVVAITHDHFK